MQRLSLAVLVVAGSIVGPVTASAQPYSGEAAFGTLYTSFGLLQALDARWPDAGKPGTLLSFHHVRC